MASSSSRIGFGVIAVGLALIGYWFGLERGKTRFTQPAHQVSVNDKGEPGCEEVRISLSDQRPLTWVSADGTYPWIRFQDPKAFSGSKIVKNVFYAGTPNPSITPPVEVHYYINVVNTRTPTPKAGTPTPTPQVLNGRIIIDK